MPKITKTKQKPSKKKSTNALTKHLPANSQPVKNTADYYHCLANTWTKGKQITACCSACKKNGPAQAKLRQQEVHRIKVSWKQIGLSLSKLIPTH